MGGSRGEDFAIGDFLRSLRARLCGRSGVGTDGGKEPGKIMALGDGVGQGDFGRFEPVRFCGERRRSNCIGTRPKPLAESD